MKEGKTPVYEDTSQPSEEIWMKKDIGTGENHFMLGAMRAETS